MLIESNWMKVVFLKYKPNRKKITGIKKNIQNNLKCLGNLSVRWTNVSSAWGRTEASMCNGLNGLQKTEEEQCFHFVTITIIFMGTNTHWLRFVSIPIFHSDIYDRFITIWFFFSHFQWIHHALVARNVVLAVKHVGRVDAHVYLVIVFPYGGKLGDSSPPETIIHTKGLLAIIITYRRIYVRVCTETCRGPFAPCKISPRRVCRLLFRPNKPRDV